MNLGFVSSAMLRAASMAVPRALRSEWLKEWRAELWHVRHAQADKSLLQAEQEIARFCFGAFEDALCLRRETTHHRVPLATTRGSARQCLLFLAAIGGVSVCAALVIPGVRAKVSEAQYQLPQNLVLIRNEQRVDTTPPITVDQLLALETQKQRYFDAFASYRIVTAPMASHSNLAIAHVSPNLFELLHLPVRFLPAAIAGDREVPQVILSERLWKKQFAAAPNLAGEVVRLGSMDVLVAGIMPADAWQLPATPDAWQLDSGYSTSTIPGIVVARRAASNPSREYGELWSTYTVNADESEHYFLCSSLVSQNSTPLGLFLFAAFLACLALPATTPLPLGEYRLNARHVSWSMRLRRWSFLLAKLALLVPIGAFVAVDIAYAAPNFGAFSPEPMQLVLSFALCLFGLRWVLRDQRQRCPVCLGKLTHPARVGQPSRTFLAWNGTELICVGGHGLLHVPELETSWFSTQRWMYLDASWDVLFAEPTAVTTAY